MTRTPIWQAIAATLSAEIAGGHYPEGSRLPSEEALARRFGVNRHTLRRGLADLATRGLIHARRGAGAFVTARPPADYPLGPRVRFHRNLETAGRVPGREILALLTRPADPAEAQALQLAAGEAVHVCEGISLADGQPLALFRSIFPGRRFPDLPQALRAEGSITRALALSGLGDYLRASTRLSAVAADATQALHLRLPEGAPLLLSVAVNADPEGVPVELGQTWFAGERVTLVVPGAAADGGTDP